MNRVSSHAWALLSTVLLATASGCSGAEGAAEGSTVDGTADAIHVGAALRDLVRASEQAARSSDEAFISVFVRQLDQQIRLRNTTPEIAIREIFNVELPKSVTTEQFLGSLKAGLSGREAAVRAGGTAAETAARNLQATDSAAQALLGHFDEVARELRKAGIEPSAAMEILVGSVWMRAGGDAASSYGAFSGDKNLPEVVSRRIYKALVDAPQAPSIIRSGSTTYHMDPIAAFMRVLDDSYRVTTGKAGQGLMEAVEKATLKAAQTAGEEAPRALDIALGEAKAASELVDAVRRIDGFEARILFGTTLFGEHAERVARTKRILESVASRADDAERLADPDAFRGFLATEWDVLWAADALRTVR